MWSMLYRALPGPAVLRLAVIAVVIGAGVWFLFEVGFPWASENVGFLEQDPAV
ncbi:MAG: hypothetical protein ACTMIR_09165 [Cellulomonadaceae bacterium]